MKKLVKWSLLIMLCFLFLNSKAHAVIYEGSIHRSEYISDLYIHKGHFSDGYYQYYHAGILRKSTDNNFVYCLEPFVSIEDDYSYEIMEKDYANLLNLSDEDWHRIELLAYYGYNYQENGYDHTSKEWYYITQMEIWRIVDKDINIYFTNGLNGSKKELFTDEFSELNRLVDEHYLTPSITMPEKMTLNKTYTLNDLNNVLKNYEVSSSSNIKVLKDNNALVIEPLSLGEAQITFTKKGTLYSHEPILYFSNDIQKTLEVGNYTPTIINLATKVVGTKIKIIKIDAESSENLALPNLKFQIIDENNTPVCFNEVCEFTTNENGIIELDKVLGYGKYTLKELDSSMPGYTLNPNPLEFTIDETTPEEIEIHYPNKRVKGEVTIYKYGEKATLENDGYTYTQIPLDDVILEIYANKDIIISNKVIYHKDDLVTSLTTKEGIAQATLELGSYYIIEKKSNAGNLIKEEPIYFTLDYIDNKTELVLKNVDIYNYLPKANLLIMKEDQNNHQRLKGTVIALYNQNNEKILTGTTDEDGLITFNNLPLGSYYLQEIASSDGYQLNSEIIPVELTKDGQIIRLTIYNLPIEEDDEPDVKDYYVEVPDTNITYYTYTFIIPKKNSLLK